MAINSKLYGVLLRCFGSVEISNEGDWPVFENTRNPLTKEMWLTSDDTGEYYRVSCPFCDDTTHRLYINNCYAWGRDRFSNSIPNQLWMAICYNEGCVDEPANQQRLKQMIFGIAPKNSSAVQTAGPDPFVKPLVHKKPESPGMLIELTRLSEGHPARTYLEGRGFDLHDLQNRFDTHYCADAKSQYSLMNGRIATLIKHKGQLVGFQGRYPGELDWKEVGIPKYYTMPHMRRRDYFYGYDVAKTYRTVALVEGVTDVWSLGGPGVGVLGGTISKTQQAILREWQDGAYIQLLDTPAGKDAAKKEAKQIEVFNTLKPLFKHGAMRITVSDDPDIDPGGMASGDLWEILYDRAEKHGVEIV